MSLIPLPPGHKQDSHELTGDKANCHNVSLPTHPCFDGFSDSLERSHGSARRANLVFVVHVRHERLVTLVALAFFRERRQLTHTFHRPSTRQLVATPPGGAAAPRCRSS